MPMLSKSSSPIAVDHCCDVMQSWQIRNNSDIMNGNIPIDHGIRQKNIGILSAVGGRNVDKSVQISE